MFTQEKQEKLKEKIKNSKLTKEKAGQFLDEQGLTDAEFEELITMAKQYVEIVVKDTDNISPTVIVQGRPGEGLPLEASVFGIIAPFNEAAEKQLALQAIGKKIHKQKLCPFGAVLISEAWTSTQTLKDGKEPIMPSQDPNRQEAIIIGASRLRTDQLGRLSAMKITRDANNKIIPSNQWDENSNVEHRLLMNILVGFLHANLSGDFETPGCEVTAFDLEAPDQEGPDSHQEVKREGTQ